MRNANGVGLTLAFDFSDWIADNAGHAVAVCFAFSKDLVVFLEAPVAAQGVRFLQLSPGEFFFTTLKVGGYAGVLLCAPTVIYELVAYVVPGLTKSERTFMAPVVFGSSLLFYAGLAFSYEVRVGWGGGV